MTAPRLLAKICQYYYRDELTMGEIAQRLHMSRHRVGRLLREAQERNIVRIDILTPYTQETELERRLEAALGLKSCVAVSAEPDDDVAEIKRRTCVAAAEFLGQIVSESAVIGIGWGSTTLEFTKQLPPTPVPKARVVQITGGNKRLAADFDCQGVTRRLAEKLGAEPVYLHAPCVVDTRETRDLLLADSAIRDTVALFGKIEIAIVGVGSLLPARSSTLIASGYVSPRELDELERQGAVGDVFSYFIDARGNSVRTELYDRLITIGIPDIRRVPISIAIAVGAVKTRAIAAAVRGGFVNTLIVDSELAQALLALPAEATVGDRPRATPGRDLQGEDARTPVSGA